MIEPATILKHEPRLFIGSHGATIQGERVERIVNRLPDLIGVAASMDDLFTPDDASVIPGQVTLRRGVIATERGQQEAVLIYDRPADGSFDVTRVLLIVKNPATNDWSAAKSATVGARHLIPIAEAEVGQRIKP